MNRKSIELFLFILTVLLGCRDGGDRFPLSSIAEDFPVVEQLDLQLYKTLTVPQDNFMDGDDDITLANINVVDDSVLWFVTTFLGSYDDGTSTCYDLNTGELLAEIGSRGEAPYQVRGINWFEIMGDTVYFHQGRNVIKSFVKEDIVRDLPFEERRFNVTVFPDSVWVSRMTKLPNGSVIATIRPAFEYEANAITDINENSVVVWDGRTMKGYQTIDYSSFGVKPRKRTDIPARDLIKWTYAQGYIQTRGNELAVFASSDQFMLYTLDLVAGNVPREKRYTSLQYMDEANCFLSTNAMRQSILDFKANDRHIVCKVGGYFSEEDKENDLYKEAIFVFDWDLNPVKRFDLPDLPRGYFSIANDARSVYFNEFGEEFKLTLYKADLEL